ncbi:VCBS repeat-containing protein [Streptomyces tanashiensis]
MARSQADGTAVKLLDHAESVMKAADGTLLAVGTTADRGAGVYRLSVADGATAGLIASSGQPGVYHPPHLHRPQRSGHPRPRRRREDPAGLKFSTTEADLSIELQRKGGGRLLRRPSAPVRPAPGSSPTVRSASTGPGNGSGTYRSSAPAGE